MWGSLVLVWFSPKEYKENLSIFFTILKPIGNVAPCQTLFFRHHVSQSLYYCAVTLPTTIRICECMHQYTHACTHTHTHTHILVDSKNKIRDKAMCICQMNQVALCLIQFNFNSFKHCRDLLTNVNIKFRDIALMSLPGLFSSMPDLLVDILHVCKGQWQFQEICDLEFPSINLNFPVQWIRHEIILIAE